MSNYDKYLTNYKDTYKLYINISLFKPKCYFSVYAEFEVTEL